MLHLKSRGTTNDEGSFEGHDPLRWHLAPKDITLAEQALHRRATEVAIWAMPLMNYKAIYDSLHEVVGVNYNGDWRQKQVFVKGNQNEDNNDIHT